MSKYYYILLQSFFIDIQYQIPTLNSMIRFKKAEINKQNIPSSTGIFTFYDEHNIIFVSKTTNLDNGIRQFFKIAKDDKNIFQIISQTTEIAYEEHSSLFAALIHQKKLENRLYPEFNSAIKAYEKYVYLGINFEKPPYLNVVEDIQQNQFYIGPFKNRFFLFDLLDDLAELLMFPVCPDEKPYPCERYKNDKCKGWCIKEKHEAYQKVILPLIIPNEKLLSSKYREYEVFYNELQFEKAEKLKNKIQQIEKYFKYLRFIAVTKNLNLEFEDYGKDIIIKNGRINGKIEKGIKKEFPLVSVNYRKNEIMAFDKSQLAERRIVYNYLLKKNDKIILDKIEAVNKKFLLKLKTKLT